MAAAQLQETTVRWGGSQETQGTQSSDSDSDSEYKDTSTRTASTSKGDSDSKVNIIYLFLSTLYNKKADKILAELPRHLKNQENSAPSRTPSGSSRPPILHSDSQYVPGSHPGLGGGSEVAVATREEGPATRPERARKPTAKAAAATATRGRQRGRR
jgi:hypothetical protein